MAVGYKEPLSSVEKIHLLIDGITEEWYQKMRSDFVNDPRYNNTAHAILLPPEPIHWHEEEDEIWCEIPYNFERYCWTHDPDKEKTEFVQKLLGGKTVFDKIIELLKNYLATPASAQYAVQFIQDTKTEIEKKLIDREQATSIPEFKEALRHIRRWGINVIEEQFIDLLSFPKFSENKNRMLFSVNQNKLAIALVLLLKAGIIESSKKEVAEFAKNYFIYTDDDTGERKIPSTIKSKIYDFFNGHRTPDNSLRDLLDMIERGKKLLL